MKLQLVRSATLRVTYGGHCFLTDPYFADKLSRPSFAGKSKNPLVDLPLLTEEILSGIEMVLVSHVHSDHFDPAAQEALPKDMQILCQAEDEEFIRSKGFKFVYPIEEDYVWNGIGIHRVPGKHGSGEVLKEMGVASGFLLKSEGEPSVLWAGDTLLSDDVKEIIIKEQPEIIITHSSGAEWGDHVKILMDAAQTVEVCRMAHESIVVAVHMDSLDHGTETRYTLREYARKSGIKDEQLIIPMDGEIISF